MNRAARRKQQRTTDKIRATLAQGMSRYEYVQAIQIERRRNSLRGRLKRALSALGAYLNQRVA